MLTEAIRNFVAPVCLIASLGVASYYALKVTFHFISNLVQSPLFVFCHARRRKETPCKCHKLNQMLE